MRKIGNVLLDLEPLLDEMVDQGLQLGDILALIKAHIEIHQPSAVEQYEDGTEPRYFYGHIDN